MARIMIATLILMSTQSVTTAEDDTLPAGWQRITRDGHFKQRPTWSPDGKHLVFTRLVNETIQVFRCEPDGSAEQRLFESPYPRMDAVYSPDGKQLAFVWDKISPGQGDMELYLADSNSENPQPLFVTEGKLSHEEWPSWSSDGKWIVCTSTRDENSELYLLKADGTERQRLTSDPALDVHPAFSPAGGQIAFATNRWGDFEIAVYDVQTSLITRLTENAGLDDYPAWSPDGRMLAWTSNLDGNREIRVMLTDGSQQRNLTQHEGADQFPAWTPAGEVTFVSFRDGEWDIYRIRP